MHFHRVVGRAGKNTCASDDWIDRRVTAHEQSGMLEEVGWQLDVIIEETRVVDRQRDGLKRLVALHTAAVRAKEKLHGLPPRLSGGILDGANYHDDWL